MAKQRSKTTGVAVHSRIKNEFKKHGGSTGDAAKAAKNAIDDYAQKLASQAAAIAENAKRKRVNAKDVEIAAKGMN